LPNVGGPFTDYGNEAGESLSYLPEMPPYVAAVSSLDDEYNSHKIKLNSLMDSIPTDDLILQS
jgi:hypothetical protein